MSVCVLGWVLYHIILDHNVRCISYLGPIKIIENYSPKSHHDLSWMDTDKNAIQGLVRGEIKTKEWQMCVVERADQKKTILA